MTLSMEIVTGCQPWGGAAESCQTVGGRPSVGSALGLFVKSNRVLLSFKSNLCNLNQSLLTQRLLSARIVGREEFGDLFP